MAAGAMRIEAAVYTWNADSGGNWSDTTKWNPNTGYPNGVGDEAQFVKI